MGTIVRRGDRCESHRFRAPYIADLRPPPHPRGRCRLTAGWDGRRGTIMNRVPQA